jgi:hypothetical protein
MALLAGGREPAIGDIGVKLGPYPYSSFDLEAGHSTPILREWIEHLARHPHSRIRKARSYRAGIAKRAVLFDGELEIGDPAASIQLIADDYEGVALDAFDLQPILATPER